mgnify:CR=1 FL=1
MIRVLISGPESTGKSELAIALAKHYGGIAIPEYAREYVEKLEGTCSYSDVEHIARRQEEAYLHSTQHGSCVFFDTWLIVTRVWFEVAYKQVPSWIDEAISQANFDLVLLCHTDLPWVSDGLRENGGKMRDVLQERYRALIQKAGWKCFTVSGMGAERLRNAILLIDKHIVNDKS